MTELAYHTGDEPGYSCEPCIRAYCELIEPEAREYAQRECRIAAELPQYDEELEYRPTPEEYARGNREAYTPNAFVTRCRHDFTNYETIIRELNRDVLRDRIAYEAVRERIHELLCEQIPELFVDWFW